MKIKNICPYKVCVVKNEKDKSFIHIVAHGTLNFGNLKPINHMLANGFYLFSSPRWMKKKTTNIFKITIHF
jgi:hypothetical protein